MKLVAAFCYRYEPEWLVDQLIENLAWVDDFAIVNTAVRPCREARTRKLT